MSRISKTNANTITNKILSNNRDNMEKLRIAHTTLAYELAIAETPKTVINVFKDNSLKAYLRYSSSMMACLEDTGKNFFTDMSGAVPTGSAGTYNVKIKLNKEDYTKLQKAVIAYERAKDEYNKLRTELREAIYSLKTHKRVIEEFPDYAKYINQLTKKTPETLPSNLVALKSKIVKTDAKAS